MSLLVAIIIALVIVGLLLWAIDYLPIAGMPANLLKVLVILLAVLWIVQRTGVLA